MNVCILNSDNPRRCICAAGSGFEAFCHGRAGDADCQYTQDIEDDQARKGGRDAVSLLSPIEIIWACMPGLDISVSTQIHARSTSSPSPMVLVLKK